MAMSKFEGAPTGRHQGPMANIKNLLGNCVHVWNVIKTKSLDTNQENRCIQRFAGWVRTGGELSQVVKVTQA